MKKPSLIFLSVVLVGVIAWLTYIFAVKQIRWYDYNEVASNIQLSFPIKTPYKAASYAKRSDKYSIEEATNKLARQNIDARWQIRTERILSGEGEAGNWMIYIHSKGVLPSYGCKMGFQPDGSWTLWNKCSWNK
jgi:hypothetical protein